MSRIRFLPVCLASFAVTVSLLTPGALRGGDAAASRLIPVVAARA